MSAAVLDLLVPASGAELDSGQAAVDDFTSAMRAKTVSACLAADGLPAASELPTASLVGNSLLPDITAIRARGQFEAFVHVPRSPAATMPPAERRAYTRAVARCSERAPTLTATIFSGDATALASRWMNIVTDVVEDSPAVRRANQRAAACSDHTPFAADSYIDTENAIADAMGRYCLNHDVAQGDTVNREGVQVFSKCFAPAVETVQQQLAARQASFLAENALALRAIQQHVGDEVGRLTASQDVRFGAQAGTQ